MDFLNESGEKVYYFTLEDSTLKIAFNEHPENLFRFIPKNFDSKAYVLIDEIQYLADPLNFLKYHYDLYAPGMMIIATCSSAFNIDEKFTDSLAGRKKLIEVYTMDFDEFLTFRTGDSPLLHELQMIRENPEYLSLRRNDLLAFFDEYLTYGGYPAVVLAKGHELKKAKLRELMTSYLKRDILESVIKSEETMHNLLKILADGQNKLVNKNELSNTLRVSTTTIENYLFVLRKCFHIMLVKPFFTNVRKEITKMPVVYFHDLGFRNTINNLFGMIDSRPDKGSLIENYIFIRMREKYTADEIHYWRTADGNEVDFVIDTGEEKFAIEAKFDHNQFRSSKYKRFVTNYPPFPLSCRSYIADNNLNHILGL